LNELGYSVDALVLNAAHWTPQSRPRLFVIAKPFAETTGRTLSLPTDVRPDLLQRFIFTHQHIAWDLRDLPRLPERATAVSDIVEDLPADDPRWWNRERTAYFLAQLSARHAVEAGAMIRGRTYSYATAFRRVRHGRSMAELRTDGVAGCLRTPRGGSGRQILVKAGRGMLMVRLLTPRECARLQGVPDDFVIAVPSNKALFGFGDAVCVPVIEWLAEHYLTPVARALCASGVLCRTVA
jgi:DNA (cytosine-5)-methyltransferase 1